MRPSYSGGGEEVVVKIIKATNVERIPKHAEKSSWWFFFQDA